MYTKSGYEKQTYSGISDTHHSLLRLLLLLGESPTTDEGMIFKEDCQEVSQQKYLSRDEYYQRIEDEAQKGESAVEWVNQEWVREIEEESEEDAEEEDEGVEEEVKLEEFKPRM